MVLEATTFIIMAIVQLLKAVVVQQNSNWQVEVTQVYLGAGVNRVFQSRPTCREALRQACRDLWMV